MVMTLPVPERKQIQPFEKSVKLVHLLTNLFYFWAEGIPPLMRLA
jgi:hypothetical protein